MSQGEFTTMSGRRLRNTVTAAVQQAGLQNSIVVIAGLTNAYSHYIATFEEFRTDFPLECYSVVG